MVILGHVVIVLACVLYVKLIGLVAVALAFALLKDFFVNLMHLNSLFAIPLQWQRKIRIKT